MSTKGFLEGDQKILILVRHAHRNVIEGESNNGLSDRGLDQALHLADRIARMYPLDTNVSILASPKRRCIETMQELAQVAQREVVVDPLLDEQSTDENTRVFHQRIQKFIDNWKQHGERLTIACSHGDWLPVAFDQLVKMPVEFEKGGLAEVVLNQNQQVQLRRRD